MATSYTDLSDFLRKHRVKDKSKITHTRIGSKTDNITGGSYEILEKDKPIFYQLYNKAIKSKCEYLTEKQNADGVVALDLDFRYNQEIDERQHTETDIDNIVDLYISQLNEIVKLPETLNIYVFEKPSVNDTLDVTKDGIHILIGVSIKKSLKVILRNKVLKQIANVCEDLDEVLINDWSSVIDEGVSHSTTNWQLYGSRKPNHEAYQLTYHYECQYDSNIDEWSIKMLDIAKFDYDNKLNELSVQHNYELCEMKEEVRKEYENQEKKVKKPKVLKVNNQNVLINYAEISSEEKLDQALEKLHLDCVNNPKDYKLKEIHDYTMILPKKYWGPGSYDKWIRVGWALRNTDFKLYITWLKFSSQSSDFNWTGAVDLWRMWTTFSVVNDDALTDKSIYFWAKQDATSEYEEKKRQHIKYYIDETVETKSDYDKANVLYQWYKDRFICVSIKNNIWYEYKDQRWFEIDSAVTLRNYISTDIFELFMLRSRENSAKLCHMDQESPEYDILKKKNAKIVEVALSFKKTDKKNSTMREARDLFYVKDFLNLLDSKNYILCFNNGVMDFDEGNFRNGIPEDYTSKCTNIDYIRLDEERDKVKMEEINTFMYQLFPNNELREYMWQHLASTLLGMNSNQTFNIYTGRGRNGKSKLVEFMSLVLGDYKATVPITLITQKRNSIGSTSSEIVQLMGVRYAVMQEPSLGDSINEGIMKEITGGDPIQGRALFKDTVTFVPQFKLVACVNQLFDIKSNDDGTWRRIRVCDFISLFTENPVDNDTEKPYQFKVDKHIETKFEEWKCVFMAMLVNKALQTKGEVIDCDIVCAKSQLYRETQDHFAEYIRDNIKIAENSKIETQTELKDNFNQWWKLNYGGAPPNGKGLFDFMNSKFGKFQKGVGWLGISLDDEDVFDNEDDP